MIGVIGILALVLSTGSSLAVTKQTEEERRSFKKRLGLFQKAAGSGVRKIFVG
jgi:hypothetical protein